jgi:hypothetical protein
VWLATVLAALIAFGALIWAWRSRGGPSNVPGLTFYLDEKSVMDIYVSGGYGDAMEREVEIREDRSKGGKFVLKLPWGESGGNRTTGHEEVTRYIKTASSIAVIRVVLDALESQNGVVHVDLRDRTVLRNKALQHAVDSSDQLKLRRVDSYISVRGLFRMVDRTDSTIVLRAPYGDPDDPADGPQLRLECHHEGLRMDAVPDGVFKARCLGTVQSWKAGTAELVIHPIAIFQ